MSFLRRLAQPILRRVEVFPADEVTSVSPAEVPAREAGITQSKIDEIWDAVVDCYEEGLQPAISICIRHRGQVVLDRAIGHTHGNGPEGRDGPLVPATPSSLFSLFSASKPVCAMVMHHLAQRGLIHIDDYVADYVDGFAHGGKDKITIGHVLCHRAGIAALPKDFIDLDVLQNVDKIDEMMNALQVQSSPGRVIAYHAITGGFVCDAVCRAVSGQNIREYQAEHILNPLGFEHMNFGVDAATASKVAKHYYTGELDFPPFSQLIERSLSAPFSEVIDVSNDPRFHTAIIPSGNVVSTANEASRYFQLLLNEGVLDGVRIFEPQAIKRALVERSYGVPDAMLTMPIRYTQGFWLGSSFANLFGRNTHRTFGHMGFTNTVVWADPDRDISVAFLNNGKPFITLGALKSLRIPRVISEVFAR